MDSRRKTLISIAAVVLISPVAVYLWTFGWHVSSDHARWGEFGSAMSGIYAPALTFATLAVLVVQFRLQAEIHKHQLDQAFSQQARADIEFYVERLDLSLSTVVSQGRTLRSVLHAHFQPAHVALLDSEHCRRAAKELNEMFPQVLAAIHAIQAILSGLSATQEGTYRLNFSSALQKLIAVLSFQTCVALENFDRTVTENRMPTKYYFSPLLSRSEEL